jgi:hypothetical protein
LAAELCWLEIVESALVSARSQTDQLSLRFEKLLLSDCLSRGESFRKPGSKKSSLKSPADWEQILEQLNNRSRNRCYGEHN